jgi:hypothetical protein
MTKRMRGVLNLPRNSLVGHGKKIPSLTERLQSCGSDYPFVVVFFFQRSESLRSVVHTGIPPKVADPRTSYCSDAIYGETLAKHTRRWFAFAIRLADKVCLCDGLEIKHNQHMERLGFGILIPRQPRSATLSGIPAIVASRAFYTMTSGAGGHMPQPAVPSTNSNRREHRWKMIE